MSVFCEALTRLGWYDVYNDVDSADQTKDKDQTRGGQRATTNGQRRDKERTKIWMWTSSLSGAFLDTQIEAMPLDGCNLDLMSAMYRQNIFT